MGYLNVLSRSRLAQNRITNTVIAQFFSASHHGAEVLHGPGERQGELLPGLRPRDVPRVPRLDEHLAAVVAIGQGKEVRECRLLPSKERREGQNIVLSCC